MLQTACTGIAFTYDNDLWMQILQSVEKRLHGLESNCLQSMLAISRVDRAAKT